jgi:hypothetical protein
VLEGIEKAVQYVPDRGLAPVWPAGDALTRP